MKSEDVGQGPALKINSPCFIGAVVPQQYQNLSYVQQKKTLFFAQDSVLLSTVEICVLHKS